MFKITLETFNCENTANNEVFLVILVRVSHWLNANLKN